MFGRKYPASMINSSAETESDRRRVLRSAGLAGLGVIGATTAAAAPAHAEAVRADAQALSDASVLNFALILEYLASQFYLHAVHGEGLAASMTSGTGTQGRVTGGRKVHFRSRR